MKLIIEMQAAETSVNDLEKFHLPAVHFTACPQITFLVILIWQEQPWGKDFGKYVHLLRGIYKHNINVSPVKHRKAWSSSIIMIIDARVAKYNHWYSFYFMLHEKEKAWMVERMLFSMHRLAHMKACRFISSWKKSQIQAASIYL